MSIIESIRVPVSTTNKYCRLKHGQLTIHVTVCSSNYPLVHWREFCDSPDLSNLWTVYSLDGLTVEPKMELTSYFGFITKTLVSDDHW